MKSGAGLRGAIRAGVTALWVAITVTANEVGIDVSETLLTAWGAVYFAAFGIGEAVYDHRRSA